MKCELSDGTFREHNKWCADCRQCTRSNQASMILPEPHRSLLEEFSPSQVTQACQGDVALLSVHHRSA